MGKVLRLNISGMPTSWISREEAAGLYVKKLVVWEIGESELVLRGGKNRATGYQSILAMKSIIATKGVAHGQKNLSSFNNRMLFRRDNYMCMYCGMSFCHTYLTRDHIIPRAQGGKDIWENVVAACKSCNNVKADRTPEQAGMPLLAIPFKPNIFETMYLAQHKVLADQMDYLKSQFSGFRSWKAS